MFEYSFLKKKPSSYHYPYLLETDWDTQRKDTQFYVYKYVASMTPNAYFSSTENFVVEMESKKIR